MHTLLECQKNTKVKVVKLHASTDLKQRLISFGIIRGAEIEVLEYAPRKSTVEVKVAKMRIALRNKEAQMIEVEEL